jgi:hypothetical protein
MFGARPGRGFDMGVRPKLRGSRCHARRVFLRPSEWAAREPLRRRMRCFPVVKSDNPLYK